MVSGMSSLKLLVKLSCQVLKGPDNCNYKVYIFSKGTFVNKGDGGFTNFCCSGNYTQSGGRYKFQEN